MERWEAGLGDAPDASSAPGKVAVFLQSVWFAHRQITDSLDALKNFPAYLNRMPKDLPPRITMYSWVRYHAENYFQELYVFQNRVDVLFKQLCRAYRKHAVGQVMSSQCVRLGRELKQHLESIIKRRGEHVHQRRSDDIGLKTLGLIEHIVALGGRPQRDKRIFLRTHEWKSASTCVRRMHGSENG